MPEHLLVCLVIDLQVTKLLEMQPSIPKFTIKLKVEQYDSKTFIPSSVTCLDGTSGSPTPANQDCKIGDQIDINAPIVLGQQESILPRPASEKENDNSSDDDNDQDFNDAQKQLVVYSPAAVAASDNCSDPVPINCVPPPQPSQIYSLQNHASKGSPSVGAFAVQCAICFKWRILPSKKKYEEIREHILEQPFVCEAAREWRTDISCDDDADISQDGSRLWAIDRPNIARPPLGWERLLRIRGFGGSKFADVYYVAPSGKRLRSKVEVQRYLLEHPDEAKEVTLSQFSFQIPRPLHENYVKKRTTSHVGCHDGSVAASPSSWTHPEANTDLQLGMLNYTDPDPVIEPVDRPHKRLKQANGQMHNGGCTIGNFQQDEGRGV